MLSFIPPQIDRENVFLVIDIDREQQYDWLYNNIGSGRRIKYKEFHDNIATWTYIRRKVTIPSELPPGTIAPVWWGDIDDDKPRMIETAEYVYPELSSYHAWSMSCAYYAIVVVNLDGEIVFDSFKKFGNHHLTTPMGASSECAKALIKAVEEYMPNSNITTNVDDIIF